MSANDEVERLKRVYQAYKENPALHGQWAESNRGNQAMLRERSRAVEVLFGAYGLLPLSACEVLDVGCGTGGVLASLRGLGAQADNLCGVDLLPERIEMARKAHPGIRFVCRNAEGLEFPDNAFDLVLSFTMFSSILHDGMARNVASEICRVLRPGGAVLWYDLRYNNPRNPHVHGVSLSRIQELFPGFDVNMHTITLLPTLARRLGPVTSVLYPILAKAPPLRTHFIGMLWKQLPEVNP